MAAITRNITIRPSVSPTVSSYKIDISDVTAFDSLVVNIDHETKSERMSLKLLGKDIAHLTAMNFELYEFGNSFEIILTGNK
jgi:hypothetical protein